MYFIQRFKLTYFTFFFDSTNFLTNLHSDNATNNYHNVLVKQARPHATQYIDPHYETMESDVIWFINNKLKITTWKWEPLC